MAPLSVGNHENLPFLWVHSGGSQLDSVLDLLGLDDLQYACVVCLYIQNLGL